MTPPRRKGEAWNKRVTVKDSGEEWRRRAWYHDRSLGIVGGEIGGRRRLHGAGRGQPMPTIGAVAIGSAPGSAPAALLGFRSDGSDGERERREKGRDRKRELGERN